MFKNENVCVTGLKGTGKDVLFGNVIARRDEPYCSNLNYGGDCIPFKLDDYMVSNNTYKDLLDDNVSYYEYPHAEGTDLYISDAGVYFPSQYCGELNKMYSSIPLTMALSRQLAKFNVHFNTQNLNRVWDKIREQSGVYIRCRKVWFIGSLVIQFVTIYDKAESCIARVKPCRVRVPLFNKEAKIHANIYRDNFFNTHGLVENHVLIYINKSSHDTYYFKEIFKKGEKKKK